MAGNAIVLIGLCARPSTRSGQRHRRQFALANAVRTVQPWMQLDRRSNSSTSDGVTSRASPRQAEPAAAANKRTVINLLTIEGEEQVMLKVTIAEVQRSS